MTIFLNPILPLTPSGHIRDQLQGQRFVMGELDGSLAGLVFCQPVRKRFHGLGPRIEADVLFESGELDQIVFFPVGGHAPGDLFSGLRESRLDGCMDLPEPGPDLLRLPCDIFFDGQRSLAAVMVLIGALEGAAALRALPRLFGLIRFCGRFFADGHCDRHRVAGLFFDPVPDVSADSDDVADGTVVMFHSHIYDASAVGLRVKGDVGFDSAFAEFLPDVIGKADIGAALVGDGFNHCIKFINFLVHGLWVSFSCIYY